MYAAGTFLIYHSHLKTLLEPLNELVDRLVDKLKILADGTTSVPMRLQFGEFTLNVISKVHAYALYGVVYCERFNHIPSSCMCMSIVHVAKSIS